MSGTEVGPSAVVAYTLKEATSWWDEANNSSFWQDRIFHILAALYAIVALVALVIMFSLLRYLSFMEELMLLFCSLFVYF